MFDSKSFRVSIPKTQYRQLETLEEQMNAAGEPFSLEDIVQLAISDLLDKHFSESAKKISRQLKRLHQ